ncbi:MAG: RadC family protein [Steroidobacteraceae bacterium]|jgi:DNA repair protein RadC
MGGRIIDHLGPLGHESGHRSTICAGTALAEAVILIADSATVHTMTPMIESSPINLSVPEALRSLSDEALLRRLLPRPSRALQRHLKACGSLGQLLRETPAIGAKMGINPLAREWHRLHAALELARRHYGAPLNTASVLESPEATRRFLQAQLRDRPYEIFGCLYLNTRHHLIAYEELFRGTLDGAAVHPREVLRQALTHNAAAIIAVHNHPSGVAEPSRADEMITRRLGDALSLIEVRLLDHVIIAGPHTVSLAERGVL